MNGYSSWLMSNSGDIYMHVYGLYAHTAGSLAKEVDWDGRGQERSSRYEKKIKREMEICIII